MVELPSATGELDAEFEYDSEVTKRDLVAFLEELLSQIKEGDQITISMGGAKSELRFKEPIRLEVESDYNKKLGTRELEVEIQFREDQRKA